MFVMEAIFDDAMWRGGVDWAQRHENDVDVG